MRRLPDRPLQNYLQRWSEKETTDAKAMRKAGVVVEACVSCAKHCAVVDVLKGLGVDVKRMGAPLSNRLRGGRKVLTF